MSDFLKDIIKETGNEFATLAKDGVKGDVDRLLILALILSTHYYQVQFLVVYQQSYHANCR